MMIDNPAAASGVNSTRMRRIPGKINPIAPNISAAPMKCRNQPGSAICLVISSIGMINFITPANIKRAASKLCRIQSTTFILRSGRYVATDSIIVSPQVALEPVRCGKSKDQALLAPGKSNAAIETLRSGALLELFPQCGPTGRSFLHLSGEIRKFMHLANLDGLVLRRWATCRPLDGFFLGLYLDHPVATEHFLGLGEQPVDHFWLSSGECNARTHRRRLKAVESEQHAGFL